MSIQEGKNAYAICIACHGVNGEGNESQQAPKISGQHKWYIESSLQKFVSGARGTGTGDTQGSIMRAMVMTLDDQKIKDLAAYIDTFEE